MHLFSVLQVSKHFVHVILFDPHNSFHFTQEKLKFFDWVSPEVYMTRIQGQLICMGAEPRKHRQGVGNETRNGRKPIKNTFSRQFPIWQLELSPAGQFLWNPTQAQPNQWVKKLGYMSTNSPSVFG